MLPCFALFIDLMAMDIQARPEGWEGGKERRGVLGKSLIGTVAKGKLLLLRTQSDHSLCDQDDRQRKAEQQAIEQRAVDPRVREAAGDEEPDHEGSASYAGGD